MQQKNNIFSTLILTFFNGRCAHGAGQRLTLTAAAELRLSRG